MTKVKSRKRPRVEIEDGHLSTALAHLGNLVARTGQPVEFDPATEKVKGNAAAAALCGREYRTHWSKTKELG